jgi:hypothetical protein
MAVATFDTLKFSKALREAGVSEKHADAEAAVLAEVFSMNFKEVANKEDIAALKGDNAALRGDIAALKDYLKSVRDELRAEFKSELKHHEERFDFKLKDLEQRLNTRIDLLDAKFERAITKLTGEMYLLKWMLGVTVSLCVGIAVRLFFFAAK